MTLGSPVVCCVCDAAAVAADVVVAAVAAGSLPAMRPVAKKQVRVCSSDTCANAFHVVSSGAVEIAKHRVARVVCCLCMRDPLPLQCRSPMHCDTIPKLACSNL